MKNATLITLTMTEMEFRVLCSQVRIASLQVSAQLGMEEGDFFEAIKDASEASDEARLFGSHLLLGTHVATSLKSLGEKLAKIGVLTT